MTLNKQKINSNIKSTVDHICHTSLKYFKNALLKHREKKAMESPGSRRLPLQINDNPEDDTPLLTGKPRRSLLNFASSNSIKIIEIQKHFFKQICIDL